MRVIKIHLLNAWNLDRILLFRVQVEDINSMFTAVFGFARNRRSHRPARALMSPQRAHSSDFANPRERD